MIKAHRIFNLTLLTKSKKEHYNILVTIMMDISKSNKFLYVLFFLIIFLSCDNKNQEESKNCLNDPNIHFYNQNDSIPIFFNDKYEKKSFQRLKIEHLRNGKLLEDVGYKLTKENNIMLSSKIQLTKNDTLKIIFSDNEKIILNDFQNTEYYGGKTFLGCYFGSCLVNSKRISTKNEISIFK